MIKPSVKILGVTVDHALTLDQHVKLLISSCFFQLRNIAKLRPIVSQAEMEILIHAFGSSRLDYCNSLFTFVSKTSLDRLQVVQNAAARLLTRTPRRSHITPILSALHWLPIKSRIQYKILVVTYRALHGQAPLYITDLLQPYVTSRSLRSSDQGLLVVPRSRLKTKGDRAFEVVAPTLWNSLPVNLRSADTVDSFKKQLKTHLYSLAFL
ncbi:uncharacterized protein LOC115383145 [Salarias fasciatus]|nr:uncharacterized protein LOC115383145 [Salarias fasciatus]